LKFWDKTLSSDIVCGKFGCLFDVTHEYEGLYMLDAILLW